MTTAILDFGKRLREYIKKVARWCRSDRLVRSASLTIAPVLVLALLGPFLPGQESDQIRYAGLVLQLLGIWTVAKNLAEKGVIFNLPRFREMIHTSIIDFPKWGAPKKINFATGSASVMIGANATLSQWRGYQDKTLEERVAALIGNVEELRTQLDQTTQTLKAELGKLQDSVAKDRDARIREEAELRRLLTALGVSGIHIDAAGVVWLALGIVLSTIPGEFAHFLHWIS